MSAEIHETIKEIKKSLRLSMNGVVSTLQRRQGLDYKINFGVEIPRLKRIAAGYTKDAGLADALWQENIRECKILAILLLPEKDYSMVAEEWVAGTKYTEIADHLAMNILCKLPDAVERALEWCNSKEDLSRYCGYITLSNVFRNGGIMDTYHETLLIKRVSELLENKCGTFMANCALRTLSKYLEHTPAAAARMMESCKGVPLEVAETIQNFTL